MKTDAGVLDFLNTILKNELTAINQYFLHGAILKDWGVDGLASFEKKESIEEMNHAQWLVDRILFLEGLPNMQDLGKLHIGETVEEILNCDLSMEVEAVADLGKAIAHCERVKDYVSRDLLQRILNSEEEHIDYLETQLSLIQRIGLENYTQLRSQTAE